MERIYFKDNLKTLRIRKKLSQEQIGKVVGKGLNAVYRWERGDSEPTLKDISRLATFFDIPVDVLLFQDVSQPYAETAEQRELVRAFNGLDDQGKKVVKSMIDALVDKA